VQQLPVYIDGLLCQLSDVGGQGRKRKKVDCSMECTSKLIYMRDMNVHVSVRCQRSDSERHGTYWKVQCSGIGPIARVTDVPGESRGASLTPARPRQLLIHCKKQ
jgi:hypothetical protein